MRLLITGTPGVGKTTIARALGKRLKYRVLNEKEFAVGAGVGEWDSEADELVVPLGKLEKALNRELAAKDNIIIEGHVSCEAKLKVDLAFVLRLHPELLEIRLEGKKYREEKIQDNVFCEGIDYCLKHAKRSYGRKVREIRCSGKGIKEIVDIIVLEMEKVGA